MIDPTRVPPVAPDEMLARYILQSSHIRKTDLTIKADAFIPHPYQELSVTRHLAATPHEIRAIGAAVAAKSQRTFYGHGDISVSICLDQKLTVTAKPINGNPNHADILGWPADKPSQKMIALEIAAKANFVPT